MTQERQRRRFLYRAALFIFRISVALIVFGGGGWWLLAHPQTPVPAHWNPLEDLTIDAPVTFVTPLQVGRAVQDTAMCRAILADGGAIFTTMDDLVVDQNCGISGRGLLSELGRARIASVETRCATALRLAMWERHVVQPAAREMLDTEVSAIRHIGSYNCRRMRSAQGENSGWSSHATADSIDIIGFGLSDGRSLSLLDDWNGGGSEAAFLRRIGRGACKWFRVALGPDFNRLHSDHFHLQGPGWGYCR